MGVGDFSLEIKLQNAPAAENSKVTQYFEQEYEENVTFNIIKFGVKSFLNEIRCEKISAAAYFQIILQNFEELLSIVSNGAVTKNEFNFSSSWSWEGSPYVYTVYMGYKLYRNFNEQDPTYDYFAIKTDTWLTKPSACKHSLAAIFTKYGLPDASGNLLGTGPQTKRNIKTLDLSIGHFFGGINGFSADLSEFSPDIIHAEDYTNDTAEWEMKRRLWFPRRIDNAVLYCAASWASTGSSAAIDVSFKGRMLITASDSRDISCAAEYTTVPLRFSY